MSSQQTTMPDLEQLLSNNIVFEDELKHRPYGETDKIQELIKDILRKPNRIYKFTGSIKLHGSNMSIVGHIDNEGKLQITCQSRNNIIIAGPNIKDNYGFAHYIRDHIEAYKQLMLDLSEKYSIDLRTTKLCIYGEWCGENIQTKVALAKLPKKYVMFAVCVISYNDETKSETQRWLNINKLHTEENQCVFSLRLKSLLPPGSPMFHNIFDFKTYQIDIDTALLDPSLTKIDPETQKPYHPYIQELELRFSDIVDEIEKQCPFASAFGINGVGEGVVFEHIENGYRRMFKCKGTLHAGVRRTSKKTLDGEQDQDRMFKELMNEWISLRFEQACENVYTSENIEKTLVQGTREKPSFKDAKLFNTWLHTDIIKEVIKKENEYTEQCVLLRITEEKIRESTKITSQLLTPLIIAKCKEKV